MDASYMEVGTEVIIFKPRFPDKEQFRLHRGKILSLTRTPVDNLPACLIDGIRFVVWIPAELILATDEPLLRK